MEQKIKVLSNIHAHTKYCLHADTEMEWLLLKAKEFGMKQFTISEHIPFPKIETGRTLYKDWSKTMEEFKKIKNKYNSNDFQVFLAVESEYCLEDRDYLLSFYKNNDLDFMIFGNHNYKNVENKVEFWQLEDKNFAIDNYVKQSIDAFKSGLFFHMAHPDLIVFQTKKWDNYLIFKMQELIEAAIKYDITLGFNVNGLYNYKVGSWKNKDYVYPFKNFWELVSKTNAKVRIEFDIHKQKTMDVNFINETYDLAISWGLRENLVDLITESEIEKAKVCK